MVEHSVLGDEKNKKQPHERKILIAVLSVLAALIVGLVVAVIVVDTLNSVDDSLIVDGEIVLKNIKEEIYPMSEDEALGYLDMKIQEYIGTGLETDIRLIKMGVLSNGNRWADAYAEVGLVDVDALNPEEKMEYYSMARMVCFQLGDDIGVSKYNDLYFDVYLEYYDGGAGVE